MRCRVNLRKLLFSVIRNLKPINLNGPGNQRKLSPLKRNVV